MNGLYAIKPWFVRRLRGTEDLLVTMRVSADALTYAAVAAAGVAALAIWAGAALAAPLLWLAVAPLALIRIALNALDGSVARRTGTARPWGAALNEICDRAADTLFVAPLALIVHPALALGALAAALVSSCAGIVSHAATGERDYGGPMGKADRMLVVGVAALIAPAQPAAWTVACIAIGAGAAITAAARVVRIKERLDA
ncbi:MAG TPA: phosphatidate cytidylyltransferase [Actinomycetota bacterium]